MFKFFGRAKQKVGNVIAPVIGTLLGLGILATAISTFAINSNKLVYDNKSSNQSDSRNILYIATNYFSEQINQNGETNVNEYRSELMVIYPGLDIRRKTEDGQNAYYLYYPYQYNEDGSVRNYLRTKVKMGSEKTETDGAGDQGKTNINDTLFSEEAKIDEKFNIGNMGSLFLTENGLLPDRAYPTNEVSLIDSDIDTFDEVFSYASGSASLLVDSLIFCFIDPYGSTDSAYLKDVNGKEIVSISVYDPENPSVSEQRWIFYDHNDNKYYAYGVVKNNGKYFYDYILEDGKKVLSGVKTIVTDGTLIPSTLDIPGYLSDYDGNLNTFYETGDLGGNYYWMNVQGNANEVQSTTAMQLRAYKQDYNIDLLEYVFSHILGGATAGNKTMKITSYTYNDITDTHSIKFQNDSTYYYYSSLELAQNISNYVYEKNKNAVSDAELLNLMKIAYVKKQGKINLFDEYGPFNIYMIKEIDYDPWADKSWLLYSYTYEESKRNYTFEENTVKLEIDYFYKNSSGTTKVVPKSTSINYITLYNKMISDWSWAYGTGVPSSFDKKEALIEYLDYNYIPNTTVEDVIGDSGADQNLDGYKQSAIANALLKRYVEENKVLFKKSINGVLEDPIGLQIRTCGYTKVDNHQLGNYIKCKIEFYAKYSDGSVSEVKVMQDNTEWSYFQILTYNPTAGAIYSHTTSAGRKLYIPTVVARDGNFSTLAPITAINNITNVDAVNDKIYESGKISSNGKSYPEASTLSNNENITSNKYVNGNTTINSNATIRISNGASLYIDGDLTLDSGTSYLINVVVEPGSLLFVNGNLYVKYAVKGSNMTDCRNKGVNINSNGGNIMINGHLYYSGYKTVKTSFLIFWTIDSQNAIDVECDESHKADAGGNLNEAYKTNYAADHNKSGNSNAIEGKSLLSGTFVINGDLIFDTGLGYYANPLINATLYIDGICDMTGLWTSGLYDRCRPNFIFARTITQPDVAWSTVFPSDGLFSDTWCQTNGYLFMITEDAIDFSKLNFAAVNIYTPYDLVTSELESNDRTPWDFTEFIDKQAVSTAYFEEEMDLWGLCSLLRKGLGEVFKYEPVGGGNASIVDEITGDDF